MDTDQNKRAMIKHYKDQILEALQIVESSEAVACILSWALMVHLANSDHHILVGTLEYIEESLRELIAQKKMDKIVEREANAPSTSAMN